MRYKEGDSYIVIVHVGCLMKMNRIVLNKTNKREAGNFLLFVFLLPYVCACLWGHVGEETGQIISDQKEKEQADYQVAVVMDWGIWELPMEEYLVYRLALVMPEGYAAEAMKAQAVLLRTELMSSYREAESRMLQIEESGLAGFYGKKQKEDILSECRKAVEETKGFYLVYRGEPIQASYFKISNGHTRDAGEVWQTDKCPYLAGVPCELDKTSTEYSSVVTVEKGRYIEKLRAFAGELYSEDTLWQGGVFTFDSAGYLTQVLYAEEGKEEVKIEGEDFRHLFGLNSAAIEIERQDDRITFHVSGAGHGFGMSQYGANCMAINGKNYEQILKAFFRDTELAKFE